MLNIIITMAGEGSRFKKAGYTQPKFMIPAKGRTLFEWSVISLSDFIGQDTAWHFVIRESDETRDFIEEQCEKQGIGYFTVTAVDRLTSGQAETAYLVTETLPSEDEVLIYNIDTYINPDYVKRSAIKGDGCLYTFKAPGEHWSFARTDQKGRVVEVTEKKRISDNASVGLYYFKSAALYNEAYNRYYIESDRLEAGERYVAPLYQYLLAEGYEVTIADIPSEHVHVLGTPQELEAWINDKPEPA